MKNLESVTFDLRNAVMREATDRHQLWSDPAGIFYQLKVNPAPPEWPFDLRDIDAARLFYGQQCRNNHGVMLSMDTVAVLSGAAIALQGLFKYRSPIAKSMGMMFVGILWIPFQTWTVQINVESVEQGTTGLREAGVMLLDPKKWPKPDSKPVIVNNIDEMFDSMRLAPLQEIPSDNAEYDVHFPDHPLSKVRTRLPSIANTLSTSETASDLKPYVVNPNPRS